MLQRRELKGILSICMLVLSSLLLVLLEGMRTLGKHPVWGGSNAYMQFNLLSSDGFFYRFISLLQNFISLEMLAVALPLVLGLVTLVVVYFILDHFKLSTEHRFGVLLVLVLTPFFLQIHYGLHPYALLLLFSLLGFYCFLRNNALVYLFLVGSVLIDVVVGVFLFGSYFFYQWFSSEKRKLLYAFIAFLVGFGLTRLFTLSYVDFSFSINQLFTFLGADYGFTLILIILGIGGLLTIDYQKRERPLKTLQLLLLILSFFYEPLRVLAVVMLSYYALQLFIVFLNRKWSFDYVGQLTIILFICILIFSTSTYIREQVQEGPFISHELALRNLDEGVILTDPKYGDFIMYSTDLKPYAVENAYHCIHCSITQDLFSSQSFQFVKRSMSEKQIRYIMIDQRMRTGGVWQREEQGLLYVLSVDSQFRKVHDRYGVAVYEYEP